jgi:hypothetical protein
MHTQPSLGNKEMQNLGSLRVEREVHFVEVIGATHEGMKKLR